MKVSTARNKTVANDAQTASEHNHSAKSIQKSFYSAVSVDTQI